MQTCTVCGENKEAEAFGFRNQATGRRHRKCKTCMAAYGREHYRRNHGAYVARNARNGTATPETARRFPVRLMESGPAAGALSAAHLGALMNRPNLLSLDMGGTTAKACPIERGRPMIASELEVGHLQRFKKGSGLPIKISSVD